MSRQLLNILTLITGRETTKNFRENLKTKT